MIRPFLNATRLAFIALRRNKMRSLLTMLGILIGVGAVVMVTALAAAASGSIGNQVESFASNALFIDSRPAQGVGRRNNTRLTDADARAIAREAVSIEWVAPFMQTQAAAVYQDRNVDTFIYGTTLPYFNIRKFDVESGALWTENDELLKTKVCVLGQTVRAKLFGKDDPVGRLVRIGRFPFRVVGVLAPKGTSTFGDDQDDRIIMPEGSFRGRILYSYGGRVDSIAASAKSENTTDRAIQQVEQVLRARHRIPANGDNDFRIGSQGQMRAMQRGISSVLSTLLLGVAAISLVVGGVGIMNIMLVSVSERTREIGIRMSIGAQERDILIQFLVEAVVMSSLGGIIGMVFGSGGAYAVGYGLGWNVVPQTDALVAALAVSFTIGLVFGFLPARRAAKMDPIDALRTE